MRAVNPFEPPIADGSSTQHVAADMVRSLATKAVILGGVGILCCGVILGPIAISYANRAEAAMISSAQGQDHAGMIKLGRVLGYVALGFWVVGVVVRLAGALLD
jgi:hypothetical protein